MSLLQHEFKALGKHKLWNMPVRKVTSFSLDSSIPVFHLKLIHVLQKGFLHATLVTQSTNSPYFTDIPTIVCC